MAKFKAMMNRKMKPMKFIINLVNKLRKKRKMKFQWLIFIINKLTTLWWSQSTPLLVETNKVLHNQRRPRSTGLPVLAKSLRLRRQRPHLATLRTHHTVRARTGAVEPQLRGTTQCLTVYRASEHLVQTIRSQRCKMSERSPVSAKSKQLMPLRLQKAIMCPRKSHLKIYHAQASNTRSQSLGQLLSASTRIWSPYQSSDVHST